MPDPEDRERQRHDWEYDLLKHVAALVLFVAFVGDQRPTPEAAAIAPVRRWPRAASRW